MKRLKKFIDNVTVVFSSIAIMFLFMVASGYYVVDQVSNGSSVQMLQKQKQ